MVDDVEGDFSRPAKRRRISYQGSSDTLMSPHQEKERVYATHNTPQTYSSPRVASTTIAAIAAGGMSSQKSANHNEDEETDIIDTSDNEEVLLEDNYDDTDSYATTVLARSSPRPASSLPASSPYRGSSASARTGPSSETGMTPNNATPRVSTVGRSPDDSLDLGTPLFPSKRLRMSQIAQPAASQPSTSPSKIPSVGWRKNETRGSFSTQDDVDFISFTDKAPLIGASDSETNTDSNNSGRHPLHPAVLGSQQSHPSGSQLTRAPQPIQDSRYENPSSQSHYSKSPKFSHPYSPIPTEARTPTSSHDHPEGDDLVSLERPRLSITSNLSSSSSKSPSLTPPPPSPPPRRQTRPSNKTFAPYTAYRKQYGDAAFEELQRLEQLEASRRLYGQRSTVVDPNEDANYAASQSQVDEESQRNTQASSVLSVKPPVGVHSTNPRKSFPETMKKARPSVPIPTWGAKKSAYTLVQPQNPVPLKSRDPNAPRRFIGLDGNPVRPGRGGSIRKPSASRLTPASRSQPSKSAEHTPPMTTDEALIQLYTDDSDEEDRIRLADNEHVVEPNDAEVFDEPMEPNDGGAPTTDPDTNESDLGEKDAGSQDSEHSSFMEDSGEDEEVRLDLKRQRILAKVLPAVMIKKSAEQERERERERQRERRNQQKARRQARGLGDSDLDEDSQGAVIMPGQSKTRRIPNEHAPLWNPRNEDSDEVIDLTSDRESLDNDNTILADGPPNERSSDEDDAWSPRDAFENPIDFEAMEDNTFFDGARSRKSNANGPVAPRRRGPVNRRDAHQRLKQSRIDRMLNSTSGTRQRSKRSKGHKFPVDATSRSHNKNGSDRKSTSTKYRPPNTYIIPHSGGHIQTRLPFEPVQLDHTVAHESRAKPDHQPKKSSDSARTKRPLSNHPPADGFGDLFEVLVSRNPPFQNKSFNKLPTFTKPTPFKPPLHPRSIPDGPFIEENPRRHPLPSPYSESRDPDAKIEISLKSALAFGMRRSRKGFSLPPTSWLAQGKLLDLIRVLCSTSEPAMPLPCYVSTLRFDASTSIPDLQLQFPTVCDLIFAGVEKPVNDEDNVNVQQLMRFMCLLVSWSVTADREDAEGMLEYVATQVRALMDRVEEHLLMNGRSGQDFSTTLLSVHWFAVEISNRIAKAIASLKNDGVNDAIIINDATTDRYTVLLMARLLEFGVRRAMAAFQAPDEGSSYTERYALELWIALIHITILQPATSEEARAASNTFWKLVHDAFKQFNRHFASVVHETEFIFAAIFSLCSLSSVDALGNGQETRLLQGYWPIVCRALRNIELSPETDRTKRLLQSTLAAKDTYIGMLFARCNVLAFRWEWSLQDSQEVKQLFELLRGALKDRKFMNLLHEQSDFPYFITKRNLRLLHEFEAKDSIQTIVIKLMLKKVEDVREDIKSAKKWISLLAFTSALEFTREKPPTQKELSTLFNQFTIKFVLLYVNPDANNARAVINSSKKIVSFRNADHRSRWVCIRSAMIFGRFCRHFRLPLDEVLQWMSEMGLTLLEEHKVLSLHATPHQKRETATLCAALLGSLRDVLQTDLLGELEVRQELSTPFYLENSIGMLAFVTKLLPVMRDWDVSLAEEAALLLMTIFQSRSVFFPPPRLPPFPRAVTEEESQDDYGFDPIDIDDPTFTEVMRTHEEPTNPGGFWAADLKVAVAISELISPVASLIGRLGYAESVGQKKANVELWMQCWARIGAIVSAHNLKSWDYFLQRGPDALGRVADLAWRQKTEPLFLLEVLRSDTRAYTSDKERFVRGWFLTLAADPDHTLPAYTYTILRVDGFRHFLFEHVPFRRDITEDEYDDDAYVDSRLGIIEAVFTALDRSYQSQVERTSSHVIKRNVESLESVSEALKMMRHNISNAPRDADVAFRDYAAFCKEVVESLKELSISGDSRLAFLLKDPWVNVLDRYVVVELE